MKINITHWMRDLPVQKKIIFGYGLSLGIAIAGIVIGIVIADQRKQQADVKIKDALEELDIITNLQVDLLQTFVGQKQLGASLNDPVRLQKYYLELQDRHKHFWLIWQEFKETEGSTKGHEGIDLDDEVEAIQSFLKKHEGVPEAYIQTLDQLLLVSDPNTIKPEELVRLKASLSQLEESELIGKIDTFADELPMLTDLVNKEYAEAQLAISSSHTFRLWIIGISMTTSAVIALILSFLTSRAIAQPIRSLTDITQQAIHESNFKLQAPVISGDEIGTLALSFNQLIAAIEKLLDQKQEYSQNLEIKINERTQELNDKNIQLQELIEKLHSTQVQMIQSEKMSSLGQLVAGVAHEINNPVNFIHGNLTHVQEYTANLLGFINLYQEYYPNPNPEIIREAEEIDLEFLQEDMPKILSSMQIGTDRIREIVVSLRNFSRTDQAGSKFVNIHEGIDSTILILQYRLKAKSENTEIKVVRNYANLPLVECYPGQLNQVFMNILANAIDALEESNAKLTYQEILDHPQNIEISTSMVDAQWIQITIADNGIGMSETTRKQIFDPFFTTKHVGKGTGMGMAISHQIITEKHGGKLECHSTIGEGTQFIVQIPVQQLVHNVV